MWTDYYLKFADEADFAMNMPENLRFSASENHATDVIGVLYRTDTHEVLEGFHVNLRLRGNPLPASLEPYNIGVPTQPKRVFA